MKSVIDKFHVTGALYTNGEGCYEENIEVNTCLKNINVKCEGEVDRNTLYKKRGSLLYFNGVSINPSYILPYIKDVKNKKFCIGRVGTICILYNDEIKVFIPCY